MADNNEQNIQQNESVVMIALTKKRGGKKVLAPSMEGYESGYTIDGIYVSDGGESRIFALGDTVAGYGFASEDLPADDENYGKVSPSIGGMDGEESTQCIIDVYQLSSGAPVEAKKYGWLPSAGEFDLLLANKDAFNALAEAAGGTKVETGRYWLSQRRNALYPWFYDIDGNGCGSWLGGSTQLSVRPCMSAYGYEE